MRRVDPKVYTKEYYLSDCTGYDEFKKNFGKKLDKTFTEVTKFIKVNRHTKVLDVGCGRGELVFYCASRSAASVGIDYSTESISLAKYARTKQSLSVQKKTKFIKMDAKHIKFPDSSFDLVIMTGVVEHLYPEEIEISFKEVKRVLKPNGRFLIHTAPSKTFNDFTYKFYCYPVSSLVTFIWNRLTNSRYPNIARPEDIRKESHYIMHINEPNYFYLLNLYRKFHFEGKILSTNVTATKPILSIKDKVFNLIVFVHPFSKKFPLNTLFGSDFVSLLRNIK